MAAEVYEDALELDVPILEAVLPDSEQYLSSAYPYPSLRSTGRQESRRFRTIVLENPYLRVTIVPDLGGRILRLLDKRTNTEIFPEPLQIVDGGLRGAEKPNGIQLRYTAADRLNSLGTVNYQVVHPEEEADDAGVWIGEVGGDLSFNALISIAPDIAQVNVELRMFNRAIGDTPYNGGLSVAMKNSAAHYSKEVDESSQFGFVVHAEDRALTIWSEHYQYPGAWHQTDRLNLHRFGKDASFSLSARQLDTWQFVICPHTNVRWPMITCKDAAISFVDQGISIQSARPLSKHKVKLLDEDNQSFETEVNVDPVNRLDLPFANAKSLRQFYLVDASGSTVVRQRNGSMSTNEVVDNLDPSRDAMAERETSARNDIRSLKHSGSSISRLLPSFRYETHLKRAINLALAKGSSESQDQMDQALLYNGEDHLAWWLKANIIRSGQNVDGEIAELLNAHFLAPLEPMLRAEGFLSQPIGQGREPNPILRPLDDTPDSFVEVACLLLSLWTSEASRFIDEALRHVDLPMLRYLQAYALLSGTSMEVEVAAQVQKAAAKPFGPPFPWRPVELNALQTLAMKFKDDERLKQYLSICERFGNVTNNRA